MNADQFAGLASLFDSYLGLAGGEKILLLYTSDATDAVAMVSAGLDLRRVTHSRVWMHPMDEQMPDDGPDSLAARWWRGLAALGPLDGHALVVLSLERDTFSNAPKIARLLKATGHADVRLYRMISACPELFATALRAAPDELSARNTRILETLLPARRIRLLTAGGSDLEVELDSTRYRWISNRGRLERGRAVVLPAGEVATFPARVDGVFVADFAFNINCIVDLDARLARHPVMIEVRDSRVVDFRCGRSDVAALVEDVLAETHGRRIGELGLGTNRFVTEAVALNSHINERHCGIHLGLGQHNQSAEAVDWYCRKHLDLIADGGVIEMEDGRRLDLAALAPSAAAHRFGFEVHDEDVFSPEEVRMGEAMVSDGDCCGDSNVCWAAPAARAQTA